MPFAHARFASFTACAFIALTAPPASGSDWTQQGPLPTERHLYTVEFVTPELGWVGGGRTGFGGIWSTTDGGQSWATVLQDTVEVIRDIDMIDAQNGWAIGEWIYHTTDGWTTWTKMPFPDAPAGQPAAVTGTKIDFLSPTTGFMSTRPAQGISYLYRTTDGGLTWTELDTLALESWDFSDAQHGWASTTDFAFIRTSDGGDTWTSVPSPPDTSIAPPVVVAFSEDIAVVTTFIDINAGFSLHRTTDGGQTWTSTPPGVPRIIRYADELNAWGVSREYQIQRSTDGGLTWTPAFNPHEIIEDLSVLDADTVTVIASGEFGYAIRTENGGADWTQITSGSGQTLIRVGFADDALHGWITGESTLLHTSDGGATWTHQNHPDNVPFFESFNSPTDVWAWSATHVYLRYASSDIFLTTDGGSTWTFGDPHSQWPTGQLFFLDPLNGWIISPRGGTINRTTDGGATWTTHATDIPQDFGINEKLWDLWFLDELHGWAVGQFHRAYRTSDGGFTWQRVANFHAQPEPVYTAARFADPDHGWIVGINGQILRTNDGGDTWIDQTIPGTFNEDILDVVVVDANTMYYGSKNDFLGAYVRKTTDGGQSWSYEYTGPGPDHSQYGYVNGVAVVGGHAWSVGTEGVIMHGTRPHCPADLDASGVVGIGDLVTLLAAWGTADADLNGDGTTDLTDLITLLAAWGPCAA